MSTSNRRRLTTLLALLTLGTPMGAFAASLRVVSFNTSIDGHLSSDGKTIGVAAASGSAFAFLVTEAGNTTLVPFADVVTTPVVSADGSTVYGFGDSQGSYRLQNGVLETNLPLDLSSTRDISDDGATLVGGDLGPAYSSDGTTQTLLDGLGPGPSAALAISGDGSVIGGFSASASGQEATLWVGGTPTGLGDLSGGLFLSEVHDLSLDGSVAVGLAESAIGTEAVRWEGGVIASLGSLGTPGNTWANAVSADGSTVVGGSGFDAFIWDEQLGMRRIADVLAASGVDLSDIGFVLREAIGISADGRTVIGLGSADSIDSPYLFNDVLWVATIPEPGTGSLLLLGLVGLAATRRGRR